MVGGGQGVEEGVPVGGRALMGGDLGGERPTLGNH